MDLDLVRERPDQDIKIRVTRGQKKSIQMLARELGMTMADYIRYCITKVANDG